MCLLRHTSPRKSYVVRFVIQERWEIGRTGSPWPRTKCSTPSGTPRYAKTPSSNSSIRFKTRKIFKNLIYRFRYMYQHSRYLKTPYLDSNIRHESKNTRRLLLQILLWVSTFMIRKNFIFKLHMTFA